MKKTVLVLTLALALLCFLLPFYVSAQPPEVLTINADGSITGTDKLHRNGNTYTFTGDISHTIRVEKGNIVIDGAGYTLRGSLSEDPPQAIILLNGVGGVTIKNLNVKGFGSVISLESSGNTITGCTLNCQAGIWLRGAMGNSITDNVFVDAKPGVGFHVSSGNVFRDNRFVNSTFIISLEGDDFSNDVDTSNTIDGKPIYYIINQKDLVIDRKSHPEIGYLALQGCINVTVKDLWIDDAPAPISGPSSGIILKNTTNSTITHNHFTHLWAGIYLYNSYGNLVVDNYLANGTHGIVITAEQANTITNNTIENNEVGISLLGSAQVIYRNNLINNIQQVHSTDWHEYNYKPLPNGIHVWDSDGEGNYWSDSATVDNNHDGIAGKAYLISQVRLNIDHYPLAAPVEIPAFVEPTQAPTQPPNNPSNLSEWILPFLIVAVVGVFAVLFLYAIKRKGKQNRIN